ncbi:MAG: V-type ATPase subunit subunit G family protein [Chloroflexota bacterium]
MADQTSAEALSPLDQIRLVEAEITRKIVAAREVSERAIAEARAQAARVKKEAREAGARQGQIRYKEIVSKAEEEARGIVAHAHNQASDLKRKGQARMEAAIREAVDAVLGLRGGRADES